MKKILKSVCLFTTEIFQEFTPEIPHNFYILVSLTIGGENEAGASDYSLGVCTPTWLNHHIQNAGPIPGRHLLMVNQFDPVEIRVAVEKIISQCERETLEETNAVLARFFSWEFEDYHL